MEDKDFNIIQRAAERYKGISLRQKIIIGFLVLIAFSSWLNYVKGIDVQNKEIASRRKAVRYEEDLLQQKKQQFEFKQREMMFYYTYKDTILKYCPCYVNPNE